jgi:hypothetical protein
MTWTTDIFDWGEMVKVIDAGPTTPPRPGVAYVRGGPTGPMRLSLALRMIIEDWEGDQVRQLQAVILREIGPPLTSLKAIRAIYGRGDRPSD